MLLKGFIFVVPLEPRTNVVFCNRLWTRRNISADNFCPPEQSLKNNLNPQNKTDILTRILTIVDDSACNRTEHPLLYGERKSCRLRIHKL